MEIIRVHFAIEGNFQDSVEAGVRTWDSAAMIYHGILPVNMPQRQAASKPGVIQWCLQNQLHSAQKKGQGRMQSIIKIPCRRIPHIWH